LPLDALAHLLPAAMQWERDELKAEAEKRLFPLWLAERCMHELAGGDRKNFIAYDEYVKKVLGGEDRTELRTRAAPPPPKRTADEIIKDYMPMIEADRRRNFG
jgi:hypothetical protein